MSFREFSSTHGAPSKASPADKSKDVPAADRPPAKPDKTDKTSADIPLAPRP